MDLQRGSIECKNPNCKNTFTWVYQTRPKSKTTAPDYGGYIMYTPKENEAMVNRDNLKCYCPQPKCGTPHFLDSNDITLS